MENGAKDKQAPAPYISWKTFVAFLANMKGKLTEQIDTSVLRSMSGTARSQLLSALRFLNLIAPDGTVKDSLKELSEAYDTPEWKAVLAAFLKRAYGGVIGDLNVAAATPAMLRERFKARGGVEGTTIDNAIRFYISGLKEADIPFSPHLAIRAARVSNSPRRRSGGRPAVEDESDEGAETPEGTFRVPFDLLALPGSFVVLPENMDTDRWQALSEYVASVIAYRQRVRKE